jgi:hypothetical protein
MSAYRPPSDAGITIRDRRELPFFQVQLRAVQAIRNETTGPRRLRAIGFYALLCQLANEQRHTGEHRRVRVTYDELSARGQMSKRSVKLLLDVLGAAGASATSGSPMPNAARRSAFCTSRSRTEPGPRSRSRWLTCSPASDPAGTCCATSG